MLKIITLSLNPSRAEFPKEDRFLRFSKVRNIYPDVLEVAFCDEYMQALNGYFHKPPNQPYQSWFNLLSVALVLSNGPLLELSAPIPVASHGPEALRSTKVLLRAKSVSTGNTLFHNAMSRFARPVIF